MTEESKAASEAKEVKALARAEAKKAKEDKALAKAEAKAKAEVEALDDWESFSDKRYESEINNLVHYSSKLVNSNAHLRGVIITKETNLPYISVSSCDPDSIELDYKGSALSAKIFKQIRTVLTDKKKVFKSIPDYEKKLILKLRKSISPKDSLGDVDHQLKQIIMPDEEGNDICLTPLHSAGLSLKINDIESELLKEINLLEKTDKKKLFNRATVQFGGGKPHNVGGLIFAANSPIYIQSPFEDFEHKIAFSIYFKGVQYHPLNLIDAYLDWISVNNTANYKNKTKESQFIEKITQFSLKKGEESALILNKHKEMFKEGQIISNDVSTVQKGLIFIELRDSNWANEFSQELAYFIMNKQRKVKINNHYKWVSSSIDSDYVLKIKNMIKREVMR